VTAPGRGTQPERALQGTQPLPVVPRRFRSLASRLVALGLGQMILLAVTAVVVFIAEGPHEPADPEDKLPPAVVTRLEILVDNPVALSAELERLHRQRVEVSLYDEARLLIASNVDPPLAIPPRPPRRRPPGPPGADNRPPSGDDRPASADRRPLDGADRSPSRADNRPPSGDDRPPSADHRPPDGADRPPSSADHRPPSGDDRPASADDRPASADRRPLDGADRPLSRADNRPPSGDDRPLSADRRPPDGADRPPPPDGDRPPGDRPPGGPPGADDRGANGTIPSGRVLSARNRLVMAFHPHGQRGMLVARGVHGEPPGLTGPLLLLGGGFVILVIGALITARWIVRPIERLSRTARALGSGDLQARSRLDRADEIGELGHRFDEMAERISSLLITEKELLANVAHELRTPLTRIGVALDLANEGDSEAARASLVEIAVDVSELETIVDDILTAMRFELAPGKVPAQLPLRRAVVPAREIAVAAADRLRARHPERPLEVALDSGDAAIHVDPVLFRRVIDNLLENAHKYTPDTRSPITLAVARDGDAVVFDVRDRGIGISGEDLPRVFTAFFRSDRSRSRETGGVGLGLTLARRIVEAHGGAIDVASTINVGTEMRVTVPVTA
jgi:signal transduction histidine kinase